MWSDLALAGAASALALAERKLSAPFSVTAALVALSSPWWLPSRVVRLRFWIFTALNGDEGRQFPCAGVNDDVFKWLYNHPAASIRSRQGGVGITDLFWYMLAPAHYIHQEHLESDAREYPLAVAATRKILAVPRERLAALARKYADRHFRDAAAAGWQVVRLRRVFFPLFVRLFHEIIFDEECPDEMVDAFVRSGDNVIAALKFTAPRDMAARHRITDYLMKRLEAGDADRWFEPGLTTREKALHLQGVFYHTGSVQLSEGMAHLLVCIAQHPHVQQRLDVDDEAGQYLDLVIREQLRLFPLFGVAHRITAEDIALPAGEILPRGSVMLFNYQAYQTTGFDNPLAFIPERWDALAAGACNYIPFGVPHNRPCPGQQISLIWMKEIARVVLQHVRYATPLAHTRALPCGGLCVQLPRTDAGQRPVRLAAAMVYLRARDAVESVVRSIVQLLFGVHCIIAARRARLAVRYFDGEDIE
eukprot:m.9904 g.9904  ORF g.9904 m.9904 type:complete len:476 (-) comp2466_c0_seq1:155-1582(-)